MHLVKAAVGTGVMAMPQAMGMAGLVTSSLAMVLAAGVLTHCLQSAVRSRYLACQRRRVPVLSYEEAVAEAVRAGPLCTRRFAPAARALVTFFVNVFQLGTACIYIVFMSETLRKVSVPHPPRPPRPFALALTPTLSVRS